MTKEETNIITDAEITEAWGNANFGDVSKQSVLIDTLKKVAQGWHTGHTAMCIVKELGLVETRNEQNGLSDKGLLYLLTTHTSKLMEEKTKPLVEALVNIANLAWKPKDVATEAIKISEAALTLHKQSNK